MNTTAVSIKQARGRNHFDSIAISSELVGFLEVDESGMDMAALLQESHTIITDRLSRTYLQSYRDRERMSQFANVYSQIDTVASQIYLGVKLVPQPQERAALGLV
jgi:hypothetical protein